MKQFTLSLFFSIIFIFSLHATTYTSTSNGDWTNPNTWTPVGVPSLSNWPGDEVIILHTITLNQDLLLNHQAKLSIQNGGALVSSKKITLNPGFSGQFNLMNGADLSCSDFYQKSPSATININGSLSCTNGLNLSGGATFNMNNADINAYDLIVLSNAALAANNSTLTIVNKADLSGSSQSSFIDSNLNVGNDFKIYSGAKTSFTNGTVQITKNLITEGAGEITLNGTTVTVSMATQMIGGSKIIVKGDAAVDLNAVTMQGAATIQGTNEGGMLAFSSMNIQAGAAINCVSNSCHFGAGSTPPAPLDLKTGMQFLPVELLFFNATVDQNTVTLSWATANEQNNAFFEIEKSEDAENWSSIELIEGAINSNQRLDYKREEHLNTNAEFIYYRLKQTDIDGTFTYSSIQSIKNTSLAGNTHIYPNPVRSYFDVTSNLVIENIKIYSTQGQLLYVSSYHNEKNAHVVLPNNIMAGQYIIQLIHQNGIESHQIIVQ